MVGDGDVAKASCIDTILYRAGLHPEYIYNRVKLLGHSYSLRILLVIVDIVCS